MSRIDILLAELARHRQGLDREGYRGHRHYFSPEDYLLRERLYCEGLAAQAGEPRSLARARALAHVLDRVPVRMLPQELIVGSRLPCYVNPAALSPEQREELGSLRRRRAEAEPAPAVELSGPARMALAAGLISAGGCVGHCVPDYQSVLDRGLESIRQNALARTAQADPGSDEAAFLLAVDVVIQAAARFAARHGDAAEALAREAASDTQRRDLLAVAERCRRVPMGPARTFHDALQSLWLAHLVLSFEALASAISPGRLDQLFLPYYESDLAAGRLTEPEAQELITCLWIKFQEAGESQNVTVAGCTPDGQDASNRLTALMLDTARGLLLPQPSLSVRVHAGSPEWLLRKTADLARVSTGQPSVFNDAVICSSLEAVGIDAADARDYAIVGCYEPVPAGKANSWTVGGNVFLPKCLDLALNAGRCPDTGGQVGPATPPLAALRTFDALLESFFAQVEHAISLVAKARRQHWQHAAAHDPRVFESALRQGCVERGKHLTEGGALYNAMCCCAIGLANAADGLAALRQCVYERGEATLDDVFQATRDDFEGREPLRQALLAAPKYGNDDPRADRLAEAIGRRFCRRVLATHSPAGVRFWPTLGMYMQHMAGRGLPAGPDGRRRGEPLAFAAGPATGRNVQGPTAVLRSAARLPHDQCPNGSNALNLSMPPSALSTDEGVAKFTAMIRTYFDLGGQHLMFNIVDADTLRSAKDSPHAHRDLLVRLSGLSAYFIHLDPALQDEIIERTANAL